LAKKKGLVTFNGRSFDLPLLDNRYLMNRMSSSLLEKPHIDLLHPARRLYRRRLGSCALGALEQNLLGLHRTHEDVPGWLIPGLYHNYLRTGDARELLRVFYHNEIDMLSMVTLTSRVVRQFANSGSDDDPTDLLSLGKWLADLGMKAESERNLRMAAKGDLPLELYHQALYALGLLLKRDGRREEAVPVWQQIAATSYDDVEAHIELAKHYEWQCKDLDQAMAWTRQALALVDSWRHAEQASLIRAELEHRQDRLLRKLNTPSS
jgi:tetratricopeptide (TPR) repeat protein